MTDQPDRQDGDELRDLLFAVRPFVLTAPNRTYSEKVLRRIDTMLTILPTHDGTKGAGIGGTADRFISRYREALTAPPKPTPDAMREGLDAWIKREFTGHGLAVRLKDGSPIPGEPLMSMAEAKELTRRAVAEFVATSPAVPAEPVAWRFWDGVSWQFVDYKPDLGAWRRVEPLYASPPVRGDREALYALELAHSLLPNGPDRDRIFLASTSLKRILSLPIQPAIDKTKLYTVLSKSIPQDMIDGIWQELNQ